MRKLIWNLFASFGIFTFLGLAIFACLLFFPLNKVPNEKTAQQVGQKLLAAECKKLHLFPDEYKLTDTFSTQEDAPFFNQRARTYTLYYHHKSQQPCMTIRFDIEPDESSYIDSPYDRYHNDRTPEKDAYCLSFFEKKGFVLNANGHLIYPH
jgi:hypothetical protein